MAFVIAVALSGCITSGQNDMGQPDPAHPVEEPESRATEGAVASGEPLEATSSAVNATISTDGMAWDACSSFSSGLNFLHEMAEGYVPPAYRPGNIPGGIGTARVLAWDCPAIGIGNSTFLTDVRFAMFGVIVDPPSEIEVSGGNLYLLEWVTDSEQLLWEMEPLNASTGLGQVAVHQDGVEFTVPGGPRAIVQDLHTEANNLTTPDKWRLHWMDGQAMCWMDVRQVLDAHAKSRAAMAGITGSPAALAQPTGRMPGLASHHQESGFLTPPSCMEGQP